MYFRYCLVLDRIHSCAIPRKCTVDSEIRMTFIARFFHFRIIREFLNSRANIRVVGHFRGLKIGGLCISCERQINAMLRIVVHVVRQLKLEILFVLLSPQRDNYSVCNTY